MSKKSKMPFGKYKGKRFSKIPTSYLIWVLTIPDISKDLLNNVLYTLNNRGITPPNSNLIVEQNLAAQLYQEEAKRLDQEFSDIIGK